jgi:hypothetical protein
MSGCIVDTLIQYHFRLDRTGMLTRLAKKMTTQVIVVELELRMLSGA